jgi:hypothetical protein
MGRQLRKKEQALALRSPVLVFSAPVVTVLSTTWAPAQKIYGSCYLLLFNLCLGGFDVFVRLYGAIGRTLCNTMVG